MSASPLRAPWVEMKYSSTDSPSRKEERIGSSMMRPEGSDISPRMPAIWRTWAMFPLAPLETMMCTEPYSSMCSEMASLTASVASCQMLTVLP